MVISEGSVCIYSTTTMAEKHTCFLTYGLVLAGKVGWFTIPEAF
jgi:hypothetical protein